MTCETDGDICLQFNGVIHFGDNDGSGFSAGTQTDFELYLVVNQNSMVGNYRIGKIANSVFLQDIEQTGTVSVLLVSAVTK